VIEKTTQKQEAIYMFKNFFKNLFKSDFEKYKQSRIQEFDMMVLRKENEFLKNALEATLQSIEKSKQK
jgi:hypothetical protein